MHETNAVKGTLMGDLVLNSLLFLYPEAPCQCRWSGVLSTLHLESPLKRPS